MNPNPAGADRQESETKSTTGEHNGRSGPHEGNGEREPKRGVGFFRRRPAFGAAVAGGLGLIGAIVVGVGEVAVALAAGYGAYRFLARNSSRPTDGAATAPGPGLEAESQA